MKWPNSPPRRLPAGALMLVVVVSIIVAAILVALLLLTSNRRALMQREELRQTVRRNLFSGLANTQARANLPYLRPQSWDLFGEGTDSVSTEKKPWGVFDVAVVTSARGHFADTLVALLGSEFSTVNQTALYLTAESLPLSINGDAQVRGGAYLPKAGPARDVSLSLAAPPRTGAAVAGRLHASKASLPINCDSALARLSDYSSLRLQPLLKADGGQLTGALHSSRTSFAGPASVLFQTNPVTLAELTLTGQIAVVSSRRLVVEASAHLDNVLLIAPVVIVKPGFRGRAQIFARDTIELQPGCELQYPSAACTYAATGATQVLLGENSSLSGVVIAAHANRNGALCTIRMSPSTTIEGQIFSAGTVENCGVVRGTMMCRQLVYRTAATFYDNYLVNAVLDRTALPPAFLTSRLLNADAPIGIVAWLR